MLAKKLLNPFFGFELLQFNTHYLSITPYSLPNMDLFFNGKPLVNNEIFHNQHSYRH